jgi:signal transduction histidine kinase
LNRKFLIKKLEVKLILSVIFSFIIAVSIFVFLEGIGDSILDSYFNENSFISNQKNEAISDFRKYVSDNNLTTKDYDKITQWLHKEKYVSLYIYKDKQLIYNSDKNNAVIYYEKYDESPFLSDAMLYDVKFEDTDAKMYMQCFFQYKYYNVKSFFDIAAAFLCFIAILLFFIKRKTKYIRKLENELKILEGGNLEHEITIIGNDELSSLAQGINEMRKSFIEKLESENKTRTANSELITAMSHDLRTPLTALVGYLDIIEYKKYKTDENLRKYIHSSREKAYQIKYLSDKLFEYFIVFNTDDDKLELKSFDGKQILEQLIEEQIFILEDEGFNLNIASCNECFFIKINLISMRRVFDNIFSNINKYADKSKPIKIKYYIQNQQLIISIENQINNNLKVVSSTEIGLKTCKKIIERHNGKISIEKTEDIFLVKIRLAITMKTN